jgi:hypothetical protein
MRMIVIMQPKMAVFESKSTFYTVCELEQHGEIFTERRRRSTGSFDFACNSEEMDE